MPCRSFTAASNKNKADQDSLRPSSCYVYYTDEETCRLLGQILKQHVSNLPVFQVIKKQDGNGTGSSAA